MKIFNFLAVCAGGALGAGARYTFELMGAHFFSWPSVLTIAAVNVLGCLVFAVLAHLFKEQMSSVTMLFVFTGFLGGMTTFSSFIAHSHALLSFRQIFWAALNISAQVFLGLFVFYLTTRLLSRA